LEACIPEEMRPFGIFSMFVFNFIPGLDTHKDINDFKWCFVFPLGEYKQGGTHFEYLGPAGFLAKLNPGDVLAFRSKELWHAVMDYSGDRMSGVLFTHKGVLTAAQQHCIWKK